MRLLDRLSSDRVPDGVATPHAPVVASADEEGTAAPLGPVSSGRRAALTFGDQCLSSGSNFAVGVVVARLTGAAGLGEFTLAYATWLLLATLHRALVTDPMSIEGDARDPANRPGILRGVGAELVLGLVAAVAVALLGALLLAAGQHHYGIALMAVAPWLPFLLLQDYWRWVGFMTGTPINAIANDAVFDVVEGLAFLVVFATSGHSSPVFLAAWGAGAMVGAVYGFVQYHLLAGVLSRLASLPRDLGALLVAGASQLRSRWGISRWIAGNSLLGWGNSQAYVFVAGFILGPVGLGGLNAAQTLVTGPSLVLVQAGGSIGLPEASRSYAEHGWRGLIWVARVVTWVSVAAVAAGTAIIAVWGRTLLAMIYGPTFAHLQGASVVFGVAQTISCCGLGCILVLKATRTTRSLIYTAAAALPVSIGGVALLSSIAGVEGAACASVVVSVVGVVGVRWFQHRARLAEATRAGPDRTDGVDRNEGRADPVAPTRALLHTTPVPAAVTARPDVGVPLSPVTTDPPPPAGPTSTVRSLRALVQCVVTRVSTSPKPDVPDPGSPLASTPIELERR